MLSLNSISVTLGVLLCVYVSGNQNLTYDDLEATGIICPVRDKCKGYRDNLYYNDRNCECDNDCPAYGDCCVDAKARTQTPVPAARTNVKCLNYGVDMHTGVYVVSKCSDSWSGNETVRQKCVGPVDFADPIAAAPVTDTGHSVTYKNLYCAECNNARMSNLSTFQLKVACSGLTDLTDEQILADMSYDETLRSWGVERINDSGNGTNFSTCVIIFDVPGYLNSSVRFCRSNVISNCASNWTRPLVAWQCKQYMAVVYDEHAAYRNPHCATCNHISLDDISCFIATLDGRKRPMSFALLLDVNQSDGDQVGMRRVPTPECPSGHKYDPFFKKCRQLVCALPGHVVVNGRCVRG